MHKLALVVIVLGGGLASAAPKMAVTIGEPTVKGALDATAVAKLVNGKKATLLACFKKHEKKLAGGVGSTTATLTIGADGRVTAVTTTALLEPIDACITATITKLAFAKPTDGAPVEVSFSLTYSEDIQFVQGGMIGNQNAEMIGGWGFNRPYDGPGPTGHSSIGNGIGYGRPVLPGSPYLPAIKIGQPTTKGDLDKAIIRRYIRRNLQKLQYCYEKELPQTKGLKGTVKIAFTIGADGIVTTSTASGLSNTNVETCMAEVVKAIAFPKPKAGDVVVTYPFILQPPKK